MSELGSASRGSVFAYAPKKDFVMSCLMVQLMSPTWLISQVLNKFLRFHDCCFTTTENSCQKLCQDIQFS